MTDTRVNDPESVERAREIARRALDGKHGLLLACRDLAALRLRPPCVRHDAFDTFVAVASEIDDLPIGSERKYWDTGVLKAKDAEAQAYEEQAKGAVTDALEKLLAAL
ncbi:MAG: hypothetical protein AB7P78_02820 [Candidatus Binatia bacterium]